jgi:hypothetical protein
MEFKVKVTILSPKQRKCRGTFSGRMDKETRTIWFDEPLPESCRKGDCVLPTTIGRPYMRVDSTNYPGLERRSA